MTWLPDDFLFLFFPGPQHPHPFTSPHPGPSQLSAHTSGNWLEHGALSPAHGLPSFVGKEPVVLWRRPM